MCLIAEIIHTCSNEKVADAAVASVGSDFASKVGVTAGTYGLSIGAFTARAVLHFEKIGGEQEKQALRAAMDRSDQPILSGLQHILEPVIEQNGSELFALAIGLAIAQGPSGRPHQSRPVSKSSQKKSRSDTPSSN
jgi:hypothetical protein